MAVVTAEDIERSFAEVKALYFPRWDRAGRWRVVLGSNREYDGASGYCDSTKQVISINLRTVSQMAPAGLRAILCHEICHDVAASGHNRRWGRRMDAVARLAERADEADLAELIRNEIYAYAGTGVLQEYAKESVFSLADDILAGNTSMTVDALVARLAKHYGVRRAKLERDWGSMLRSLQQEYAAS